MTECPNCHQKQYSSQRNHCYNCGYAEQELVEVVDTVVSDSGASLTPDALVKRHKETVEKIVPNVMPPNKSKLDSIVISLVDTINENANQLAEDKTNPYYALIIQLKANANVLKMLLSE